MMDDLFPRPFRPATDIEMTSAVAEAIRAGSAGQLSRAGDAFLSTVAAEVIADRLARAGFVVFRRETQS